MTSSIFMILLNFATLGQPVLRSSAYELKTEKNFAKIRFIVFSGSDWCKNCIVFRKKVLASPTFQAFARENLEIITADFPQRIQLSKDLVAKNEALAEKYNPKGEFPKLILVSDNDSDFKVINYTNQTPEEFISEVKRLLPE
jgi:thiamine biosynthesis lipoprotein